jgi:hypothetical protein
MMASLRLDADKSMGLIKATVQLVHIHGSGTQNISHNTATDLTKCISSYSKTESCMGTIKQKYSKLNRVNCSQMAALHDIVLESALNLTRNNFLILSIKYVNCILRSVNLSFCKQPSECE